MVRSEILEKKKSLKITCKDVKKLLIPPNGRKTTLKWKPDFYTKAYIKIVTQYFEDDDDYNDISYSLILNSLLKNYVNIKDVDFDSD